MYLLHSREINMKTFKDYMEASGNKLVIVDIQEHDVGKHIKWDMNEFAEFVNGYKDVLVLFNGESLGWESKSDMKRYYDEIGIDTNLHFVEKEYGNFRDMMDEFGVDDATKFAKYVYSRELNTSQDLDLDDEETHDEIDRLKIFDEPEDIDDYHISFPDYDKDLKKYNGADIVGGACDECFSEVMILADVLGLKFRKINKWVY